MKPYLSKTTLAILPALFAAGALAAHAEEDTLLVHDGASACAIVRGSQDEYAAERLQRWFLETSGEEVAVLDAESPEHDASCTIVLGSVDSNPLSRRLADALGIDADPESLTPQGYAARTAQIENHTWILLIGGGRDGTLYAVTDLINWHLNAQDGNVSLAQFDVREIPRFKYRWFWNWDHRMDWGGPGQVGTVMGGGGSFSKEPEAYLIDFKRCVDYMADHKFNGLIIWGFLRDTHGGIEASQELCRYAARRGVRILPGVGTSGYAGYYFEGNHPFNAGTWLSEHPELRAIGEDGKPIPDVPCPSKAANKEWLDRGAKWLFDTFEIGGVNLEMGDFFVCHCEDCKKARAAIESDEPDYYKDMAISHSVTLKTMRALSPNAWLSYATYTGYDAAMMTNPPKFLSIIPEDALCQWTLTQMARNWPSEVRPMAAHNLGYLHWCNRSTGTEQDFYLDRVKDVCEKAAAAGIEGLDTYGELPPGWPNVELFYLAWEAFLWNPDMTAESFASQRLSRLYGGPEAAATLLDIIPLIDTAKKREDPAALKAALERAIQARDASAPSGQQHWENLISLLRRHEEDAAARLEAQRRREAEARNGTLAAAASVTASDEDAERGWQARKAIDGNVDEPAGYWLTRRNRPAQAWVELKLAQPARVNRAVLFHQLDPRHYRSLDYTVSLRVDGQWQECVNVRDNDVAGWVSHAFEPVLADAARLEITRSAFADRMGAGEFELRLVE